MDRRSAAVNVTWARAMVSTGSAPPFRTACWYMRLQGLNDRLQVAGQRFAVTKGRVRRLDGTAALMAEDHDERGATRHGPVLDRAGDHRADRLPTGAHHVKVTQARVEEDLRRHSGVDARQDRSERPLFLGDELTPVRIPVGVLKVSGDPALVAFHQSRERRGGRRGPRFRRGAGRRRGGHRR